MSSESPGVSVRDLWKTFFFYRRPVHRFTCWLTRGRHGAPTPFHALRAVSFRVPLGSSVGIVGNNGAGKSTLLKILTGTLAPTRGAAHVEGRLASLLELGTGFHPLFTGRQNIVYNARFLGLTDDEIAERLPEIEAFSELGEFLDRPLRTYSSGMQVRLAFAVAASVSPDVLVVDEVLAVGDAYFQQKCIQRIREFRDRGVTILFVSHDPAAVKTLCDRALLLHEGELIDDGAPTALLEHYNALIARKKADSDYFVLEAARTHRPRRSGTFAALVSELELLDAAGRPTRAVLAGSAVTVRVRVFFLEALADPTVGILVRDRLGNDVYGTNTYNQRVPTGRWGAGETLEVHFRLPLALGPGEYALTAAVHSLEVHLFDSYDWLEGGLILRVLPTDDRRSVGVAYLRPEIETRAGPPVASAAAILAKAFGELPSSVEMGGNGAALLREGWYAVEGTGVEAFRWTQRESTLLLSLTGSALHLEAGVERPAEAPPVELRVLTMGREIGRVRLEREPAWHHVAVPVPPDVARGPAHLRLVASDAWRPADTGHGADSRALGVRIRRIWSA